MGKEGFQIRLIPPKPSPWGEGGPAQPGRMRGRFRTQPFLVESLRGSRQSPQRNFSPAPLGKSIAPSSVTFGDSFPPRGSLWVVQPYPKKRPKSGHADGCRNSPSTGTMWHPTPKRASGNERVINRGSRGLAPGALSSGFLRRKPEERAPGASPLDPRFMTRSFPLARFGVGCHMVPVDGLFRHPSACPDLGRFFG